MTAAGMGQGTGEAIFAAFEQLVDAVVVIDAAIRVVFINTAGERLWGYPREEIVGRDVSNFLERARTRPCIGEAVGTEGAELYYLPIRRPDGQTVTGLVTMSPLDLDGVPHRVAILRDVTADLSRQTELQLISLAAEETDRTIVVTGPDFNLRYVNGAFQRRFGSAGEKLLGQPLLEVFGAIGAEPGLAQMMMCRIQDGESFHEEFEAQDDQERELWIAARVHPVRDPSGTLTHVVALLSNVTDTKRLQIVQRDVLEAIANDQPLATVMTVLSRRVETIAPDLMCSIVGLEDGRLRPLAAPSLPHALAQAIDGVEIGPDVGSCGAAAYHGHPVSVTDIEIDPRWAGYRHLVLPLGLRACWSSPILLRDGTVAGAFALYYRENRGPSAWHRHIVNACLHLCVIAFERQRAKAHVARLAYVDALTGLPNRVALQETVTRGLNAAAQSGRTAACLFIDVDRFKDVNDTLGHATGDKLLIEIARRLSGQTRPGDMVSRNGGDEFVVFLPEADAIQASVVAERILGAMLEPAVIDGISLPLSTSLGISLFPKDGSDGAMLLKHADTAMYQAKADGRGTVRFFDWEMNRQAQDRLVLGAALRDALTRNGLELHYQPQIRTSDGGLYGVEALARWTHPQLGPIAPSRFIGLAEECGLIEPIGTWALEAACRQMARWRAQGLVVPNVAVNLSPLHFRNRDLFTLVRDTLARNGVPPQALTIEITEGVVMDECPAALRNAHALRELGVGLSMDDFGTGYSSLSYLARLPVSELKIDRSFMRDLETDPNTQAVVTAVVRIGQSLGLAVVAEGVETAPQYQLLKGLGCDAAQGFYFARPMSVDAIEAWLRPGPNHHGTDGLRGAA